MYMNAIYIQYRLYHVLFEDYKIYVSKYVSK